MKQVWAITRKELRGYFGSPMALIFLGAFLIAVLYSFFWVDSFFSRGLSDVRPLFHWMPILMIFLVAALTMRQWSEEQRSGTLEILLTLPVSPIQLVLGKFLAVLILVGLALLLTLGLPLSVSIASIFSGNLDWGPVLGGYLATLLLAAAYAAIGLFVSSRTDNQIVALISTVLLCGLFYVLGSQGVTTFAGEQLGTVLAALGTGSRFESILRGVIDLRDLIYYLTFAGVFLTLNVLSLYSQRWSTGEQLRPQREGNTMISVLLALNLILMNVWVYPLRSLRVDLTQQQEYTLSSTTRELLTGLQEPLLIRGYFSSKTHPLLTPLIPQIEDMLEEYRIASGGKVKIEIVDPAQDPEAEAEANQTYGIRSTTFQVSGRYEASVINSYFDILLQYGDQNIVLNFQDLIEVQQSSGQSVVRLRNLEYDLTRSIKKVVYGFQNVDAVLATLTEPVKMTLYVTPKLVPESVAEVPATIKKVALELQAKANGNFIYQEVDPSASNASITPQELYDRYGLQPIPVSLFSNQGFYMQMVLEMGDRSVVAYPSGEYTETDIRSDIESALKRVTPGFLKVVGLWTPPTTQTQDMYGQTQQSLASWDMLSQALSEEYEVQTVDLSTGQVPPAVNILIVVAPQNMTDQERYAIDQYLMRGGTVVVAAGRYSLGASESIGLYMQPLTDDLTEMLASYGVHVDSSLVLDMQNEKFPMPEIKNQTMQYQLIPYPFFVQVRSDGMAAKHPILSGLSSVALQWASPITVDVASNGERTVTTLLRSTVSSWAQSSLIIQPDSMTYGEIGFPVITPTQAYTLGVVVEGTFQSYFKDKPSPFTTTTATTPGAAPVGSNTVITSSPAARLVVVSSAEFLDDLIFNISQSVSGDRYQSNLQMVQNMVDWATEDADMLAIRARGTTSRLFLPLSELGQKIFEWGNYLVAFLALVVVGVVWTMRRRGERPMALIAPDTARNAEAKE